MIPLDISDVPTRHHDGLGLWQNHIERILAGWVGELRVPISYGIEMTAEPVWGPHRDALGIHSLSRMEGWVSGETLRHFVEDAQGR